MGSRGDVRGLPSAAASCLSVRRNWLAIFLFYFCKHIIGFSDFDPPQWPTVALMMMILSVCFLCGSLCGLVRPLCCGPLLDLPALDALSAVGRLLSVCDIHSLHVVHRLRCGALAHGSLVGPRTIRAWSPRRRGSRSSPRSRGSRSRSPPSSTAELGSSGSRLGSCTPRPAAQWSRGKRHRGR